MRTAAELFVLWPLCVAALAANAQEQRERMPDPKKCVVVVDDMGNVGFRIEDSKKVVEVVTNAMRKRTGRDGVMYEGASKSAKQLQKMLGAGVETPAIQQEKLDYFAAAEANAPWRVRAKFGKTGKKNWIVISCFKAGGDPKKPVEERKLEGAKFADAVTALHEAMPSFCLNIPQVEQLPIEGVPTNSADGAKEPPGMRKKTEPKPWTPPPPRE